MHPRNHTYTYLVNKSYVYKLKYSPNMHQTINALHCIGFNANVNVLNMLYLHKYCLFLHLS